MTHEFKDIVYLAKTNQQNGLRNVLATVVFLEGSSYRKPGVRMLISENGLMIGAVSGGCVESEIKRRAQSVFKDGKAKVMTYDGRYRLGCEGILYILIEPFSVSNALSEAFLNCISEREVFSISSYFQKTDKSSKDFGSTFQFKNQKALTFCDTFKALKLTDLSIFEQTLQPCFKLIIFGGEHDTVKLCSMASLLGWEVQVITSIKDPKTITDFPGAYSVSAENPELIDLKIDSETAVVLMNHNYVQDLKYLIALEPLQPKYIGILGSAMRREKLNNDLLEHKPDLNDSIFDHIYSPAGLDIGSITPEEIALSILSEILAVTRVKDTSSLRLPQTKTQT
jgi:xanthine dehydrogenase accessory factor